MTEETQEYWSLDELESLTETVQEAKVEYQGKHIKLSWCELTESEEPKAMVLDENLPEDEKNAQFLELAREKTKAMRKKAQDNQPDIRTQFHKSKELKEKYDLLIGRTKKQKNVTLSGLLGQL
jgi:citrate synthase